MRAMLEYGQLQERGLLYLKNLYIIEANKHSAKRTRNCITSEHNLRSLSELQSGAESETTERLHCQAHHLKISLSLGQDKTVNCPKYAPKNILNNKNSKNNNHHILQKTN